MIQYKCDMCGEEGLSKDEAFIIDKFPRITRAYAKDAAGVKIFSVDKFDVTATHLCHVCCVKLAQALFVVEED